MKLYHFELDRVVEVNDRQAAVLKQSGWVEHLPEDEQPVDDEPSEAQFFLAAAGVDTQPVTYRFTDGIDSDGASWLDPPDTDPESD